MKDCSSLSLGEKISIIRKAKGLSQDNIAHILNTNRVAISRLENGETEWSAEVLATVKEFMGIQKHPLLEHEIRVYSDCLQVWKTLIIRGRFAEAKAMQEEMAIILDLPFEHDL
ncbi:MAG: helix-turn-helix domain-containing protein, partial [Defluviitaleaceae bacterium]|nr:helix-turn-helix domain-containing protein [Defluviitaleaceae bacterium]